ncbi:MAG: FHA domain-containing protein [Verrucomicrobia bacterium]|nr:FHA domain-containing protein [Verrucomicrobiota bacterium]
MSSPTHLQIEQGRDTGRALTIPTTGARLGRSSKNDIVLNDDKTSRHHCRIFFNHVGQLCVADLGSANQTIVNDKPIQEVTLDVDDHITLGDTRLRVLNNGLASAVVGEAAVDLGLGQRATAGAPEGDRKRTLLWVTAAVMVILALAATLPKLLHPLSNSDKVAAPPSPPPTHLPIDIAYEKVLADSTRIFRYHLSITPDNYMHIVIDDTGSTHIRESGLVDETLLEELAAYIMASGFMKLDASYIGIQPRTLDAFDLSVTLGKQTRRTVVKNRAEPPAFKLVREKLESFGQVELGLWAVQFPPEKLKDMSEKAFLQARKLYDERDIQHGNLAAAIKSLEEADFFLRTIDPKPDFYPQVLVNLTDYRAVLDERYVNQNFLALRAVRVGDFPEAARELRILCELIGDRTDQRYIDARRQLLEVESRLNIKP